MPAPSKDDCFAEMDSCSQAESFDSAADFLCYGVYVLNRFVLSYENGDDKRTFKNLVCVGFKSPLLWRRHEDCTERESAG